MKKTRLNKNCCQDDSQQIHYANRVFAGLQIVWALFFVAARIWSFVGTSDTDAGARIRSDVDSFRLHFATVLSQLAVSADEASKNRWRFLIPLLVVQIFLGVFQTVEIAIYSKALLSMSALYEFSIGAVGVYQLTLAGVSLIYYIYHAIRVSNVKCFGGYVRLKEKDPVDVWNDHNLDFTAPSSSDVEEQKQTTTTTRKKLNPPSLIRK